MSCLLEHDVGPSLAQILAGYGHNLSRKRYEFIQLLHLI
jgi:hypothetical protein